MNGRRLFVDKSELCVGESECRFNWTHNERFG